MAYDIDEKKRVCVLYINWDLLATTLLKCIELNNKALTILLYFAWLSSAINSLFTVPSFYCFAWREMKRDCRRCRLWFAVVTHIIEDQSLALLRKLQTDSTCNSPLNLCVAEVVLDRPQGVVSFTAVFNLEFPRLIIIDQLFFAHGSLALADRFGPLPVKTNFLNHVGAGHNSLSNMGQVYSLIPWLTEGALPS